MTDLATLAGAVCPTFPAGKVPTGQPVPYAILHPTPGTPTGRGLTGTTPFRIEVTRLITVSNTSAGSRTLTDRMVDAVDGPDWMVVAVSSPIDDRTDPSDIRWTCTVEIHHHTIRR